MTFLKLFFQSFLKTLAITLGIAAAVVILVLVLGAIFSGGESDSLSKIEPVTETVSGDPNSQNKILILDISGMILGDQVEMDELFGVLGDSGIVYGYEIKDQLAKAATDDRIKAVVLQIDSPGGTIYGAKAIASGVDEYRKKTSKPIFAYIQGLAASGGIWAAAAADEIHADYGSTIGSIGIITGPFKFFDKPIAENEGIFTGGVVTQNGIEAVTITAGRSKDLGNPYRRLTEAEIKVLQTGVDNEYKDFVSYISSRRKIDESVIRDRIGALVYDNKTAQDYKLIDGSADKEQVIQKISQKANLKEGDFQVVKFVKPASFVSDLLLPFSKNSQVKNTYCLSSRVSLAFYGDINLLCR